MIILSNYFGRLGNRLFILASFILISIRCKKTVIDLAFYDYKKYFEGTCDLLISVFPKKFKIKNNIKCFSSLLFLFTNFLLKHKVIRRIICKKIQVLDKNFDLQNCKIKNNWVIVPYGWYVSLSNLTSNEKKIIKSFFKPVLKYQKNIDAKINMARKRGDIVIGVHVRHGDYKEFNKGSFFMNLMIM